MRTNIGKHCFLGVLAGLLLATAVVEGAELLETSPPNPKRSSGAGREASTVPSRV